MFGFVVYMWIPMTNIYSKDYIPCVVKIDIYDNINVMVMVWKHNINVRAGKNWLGDSFWYFEKFTSYTN